MCPFIGLAASINFPFRPQITNCPFHQKGNARNAPKSVYLITYLAIAPKAYKRRHIRVGYHFDLLLAEASKKQKGFWKMLRSIGRLREVSLGLHRRKKGNNHIFLQYVRRLVLQIWKRDLRQSSASSIRIRLCTNLVTLWVPATWWFSKAFQL